jgi:hypothetical protein
MVFYIMAEFALSIDAIVVLTSTFDSLDSTSLFQFLHNTLHGSFSDADFISHFAEHHVRIAGEANQNMRMISQKGPSPGVLSRL